MQIMIFPYIIFLDFAFAVYLFAKQCGKEKRKYMENSLFALLCLASAVWSFGFWGIMIQTQPFYAHIFRIIGEIGMFAYLSAAQLLFCQFMGTLKQYEVPIAAVTAFSYVICFFICQDGQVIYHRERFGMSYEFKPGFWNNVYVLYCIVIAGHLFFSVIYMLVNARRKSMQVFAKKLLVMLFIVVLGMILDTILPLLGMLAIPGSTIAQFIAIVALQRALDFADRSRITIGNMSYYVYSSLTIPVLVYDDDYDLQIINDVAHDFFRMHGDEKQNPRIDDLFAVSEFDVFRFNGSHKELDTLCKKNDLPCNLTVSKIHDDYYDVIGYIITVTDLSERQENIAKLKQAIRDAESANQAKTTFLANMSHEIRTPMNAIIGFSELALKKKLSKEVKEYIQGIHLASKNLLAIINDILDITKIESGKMEIIPANYYMADLLDDVSLIISRQAAAKGLAFYMNLDPNIPNQLYGDKVRIRGVLINILNNAVKYTNEGSVSFEVKVLSLEDDTIRLSFIVSDTGIGIKKENLKNLFKSFERLDQQLNYGVEGSGLGLSIAKGYVNLMGGEITVDSEYGQGSVFTITINQKVVDATPFEHQFTIDRVQEESDTRQLVIKDMRVLLVDDNQINLMVAKGLLSSYGLMVDTASSGADAIELCKKTHYPIIFLDQMMPEMDGIEAMKRIRQIDSFYAMGGEGKIIVLTANAIRGTRELLMKEGFDEYLGKPMNMKRVEALLTEYTPEDKISYVELPDEDIEEQEVEKEENTQREDIGYLKEQLPEVDVDAGLVSCGGKVSDYLDILKINYTYGKKNLDELKSLLQEKNYKNYTIKIHAMKSTSKGIGAMEVSDMALKQEEAGNAEAYSYIDENFESFNEAYESLLQKIGEVLRHYGLIQETKEDAEILSEDMISNILLNIKNHVEAFDFSEVFDILEDVKQYRMDAENEELFAKIEELMDDLKVEEVKELIAGRLPDLAEG